MTAHDDERAATRAQVLAAFGVTEDEVRALDEASGYSAARAQAAREEAAFLAWAERAHADLVDGLLSGAPEGLRIEPGVRFTDRAQ